MRWLISTLSTLSCSYKPRIDIFYKVLDTHPTRYTIACYRKRNLAPFALPLNDLVGSTIIKPVEHTEIDISITCMLITWSKLFGSFILTKKKKKSCSCSGMQIRCLIFVFTKFESENLPLQRVWTLTHLKVRGFLIGNSHVGETLGNMFYVLCCRLPNSFNSSIIITCIPHTSYALWKNWLLLPAL